MHTRPMSLYKMHDGVFECCYSVACTFNNIAAFVVCTADSTERETEEENACVISSPRHPVYAVVLLSVSRCLGVGTTVKGVHI